MKSTEDSPEDSLERLLLLGSSYQQIQHISISYVSDSVENISALEGLCQDFLACRSLMSESLGIAYISNFPRRKLLT